jgi:hypothetical protein
MRDQPTREAMEIQEVKKKTYLEELRDPRWQQKRLKIFERDHWLCTWCRDSKTNLQVHHKDYIPGIPPYDYPDDMLTTLCEKCHARENDRDKIQKYLYNTLKMKGFAIYDLLALSCKVDTDEDFTRELLNALRNF